MILLGSRYERSPVFRSPLTARNTTLQATVLRFGSEFDETSLTQDYVWREGDRLDRLARRVYGDATKWWRIADANPLIMDPTNIAPGTIIVIPQ